MMISVRTLPFLNTNTISGEIASPAIYFTVKLVTQHHVTLSHGYTELQFFASETV